MGPIEGLKVLDLTQFMAGPYCTMVLSDLGAEVIKIEKTNGGDDSRQMGPYIKGESTSFFQINRNKKSLALNLKKQEGRKVFYELVKNADVVIEGFRPGVVKSLEVDYETLKKVNSNIIYCSISGYGQTGPNSHKGGFDLVAQGLTGLMDMTGEKGKRPLKTGIAVYDIGAGITAAYSILAAYIHKLKTGEGQNIDLSLADIGMPWFTWEAAAYFAEGTIPGATGWRHRVSAPYQAIRAKDGYMMIGCANQKNWEKFAREVAKKEEWLNDPRYKNNMLRQEHVEELEKDIESVLMTKEKAYWLDACDKSGIPAGPINNFAEAVKDEQYIAREMIEELEHPIMGKMKTIGIPTKFSKTPGSLKSSSPLLGQHTEELLKKIGYSQETIEQLYDSGIIYSRLNEDHSNIKMN